MQAILSLNIFICLFSKTCITTCNIIPGLDESQLTLLMTSFAVDCYDNDNQSTDISPDTDAFLELDSSADSTTAPLPVQTEMLTLKANVLEEITEETEVTHHLITDLNNGTDRVHTDTDKDSATALTDVAEKDVPSSTLTRSADTTTFTQGDTSTTNQLNAAVTSSSPSITGTDNAVTDYHQATTREDVPTTSTESLKENVRPTFTEIDNTSEHVTKSTINDVRNNSQHTTTFEHTGNVD